jgi:hypothetical protein
MSSDKRHPLHPILSLFLAVLVLISTTGFSVDFHICQGAIATFAINGEAKSCSPKSLLQQQNENNAKLLQESGQESIQKKPCCFNRTVVHSIKEPIKSPDINNPNCPEMTVAPAMVNLKGAFCQKVINPTVPKVFSVPWKSNTQVLHQCFLI